MPAHCSLSSGVLLTAQTSAWRPCAHGKPADDKKQSYKMFANKAKQEMQPERITTTLSVPQPAEEPKRCNAQASTQQPAVATDNAMPTLYAYKCPYCSASLTSSVKTGLIDHRRNDGCGKQLRVANGLPAGRMHTHKCPTCGTVVHSAVPCGHIQVKHRNAGGKPCPTDGWRVCG